MKNDFTTGQTGVDLASHASRHQDGGADEIAVTALSGLLADDQHVLDAEVTVLFADIITYYSEIIDYEGDLVTRGA
uniref:Uncharacterized protein n=1 Tax=viral metagenome TaxID=1070528 RepID=A0A6M3XXK7_9ZZZZ